MKKRTLSALLLAGVMAATMIPTAVFAAADTAKETTVGYVAGGNVSSDGRVMITVPKSVTFTKTSTEITGFDVKAWVWDETQNKYVTPDGTKYLMRKEVTVKVKSANVFTLKNTGTTAVGEYEYAITDGNTLNKTNNAGADTTAVEIGKLGATNGTENGQTKYKIGGTLNLTATPDLGQNQKEMLFSDKLTYEFAGL